ncbi:MAG: dTDP-4-dehydrorhamnose reductase [Abditibacteriota bacterium]|nr:dTDP-4-dehydrorhamnose reductase [Abditibacteriota bacterium]
MKVLVTGVNGQLGHDLMNLLAAEGVCALGADITPAYGGIADGSAVTGMPYEPLDITDRDAVMRVTEAFGPDRVVHCAAWTRVDDAEEHAEACRRVNAFGTRYVAEACRAAGAVMIYVSTDYVFGGGGEAPRDPDSSAFAPLNVYGETKLEGERAVRELVTNYYIVRTSWVFGLSGANFVRTMLRLGRTRQELQVVCDQIGSPTYSRDLAVLLTEMLRSDRYGVYHAANSGGYISWYDFAREILAQAGSEARVLPVTTSEYGAARAARPANSRMDTSKLQKNGFRPLPHWKDALGRYLKELKDCCHE